MGKGEFTFRNDTGEKITLKHAFKNVTGKTYSVENHGYRTLEVNLDSQTFEKYLLCDSADAFTGKYVSSDDYKNSEEVKIVKQGDKFVLNFQPRSTKRFPSFTRSKTQETGTLPITRPSGSGRD